MNLAYISIPKTASQSVNKWLTDNYISDVRQNNHKSIYIHSHNDCFSFSFIREPIDRLKSWFFHCKSIMNNAFVYVLPNRNSVFESMKMYDCSFSEWVSLGCNHHWTPNMLSRLGISNPLIQCDFVCKNGIIDVNYLGSYDNIDNHLIDISKKIKLPFSKLEHITHNKKMFEDINDIVSSKINFLFKNDFKLYDLIIEKKFLTKGIEVF